MNPYFYVGFYSIKHRDFTQQSFCIFFSSLFIRSRSMLFCDTVHQIYFHTNVYTEVVGITDLTKHFHFHKIFIFRFDVRKHLWNLYY